MEVTKREIIFSVVIVAVMLILGFVISDSIAASQADKNAEYYKAVQIEDAELFRYGMDTDVGNAFVYGDLKAVDTVTYPEIGGEYMSIEKVEEHYNRHTEIYTDSNGHRRIRTYYSWDYHDSESKICQNVNFCGIDFPSSKIDLPYRDYIETIKESSRVRFKYYGTPTEHTGTIYTVLKDKTISDGSNFAVNKTIAETLESYTSGIGLYVFWFFC